MGGDNRFKLQSDAHMASRKLFQTTVPTVNKYLYPWEWLLLANTLIFPKETFKGKTKFQLEWGDSILVIYEGHLFLPRPKPLTSLSENSLTLN